MSSTSPPTSVATRRLFDLVDQVRAAGEVAELAVYPGLWHSAHAMAGTVVAATRALDDLAFFGNIIGR
ncbi:hypothetical protein ACTWPB_11515 [Nocardia sp. IBHARD005]|uniref:hypothetical protein n=1 Tax=Nocardia sp. IBHARD005 TaxID=3457765 RepID=UPI0040598E19